MRFIPTRIHGILDYVVGIVLILAPFLFQFNRGGAETWVPVVLGVAAIVYSLFTDYEFGVTKAIPMKTHLTFDFISGVILTVSPWVFGFADEVKVPHVVVGLFEIVASLTTQLTPHETHLPPAGRGPAPLAR